MVQHRVINEIMNLTGIAVEEQSLVFMGKPMNPSKTMSYHGVGKSEHWISNTLHLSEVSLHATISPT